MTFSSPARSTQVLQSFSLHIFAHLSPLVIQTWTRVYSGDASKNLEFLEDSLATTHSIQPYTWF